MAKRIALGPRPSFARIAEEQYGDRKLGRALAGYNGIRDARAVAKGQLIELPPKRELIAPKRIATTRDIGPVALTPPNGLQEILATFGDIYKYLKADGTVDPKWEIDQMASAPLPYPIPLAWDTSIQAKSMRVHRKLVPTINDVFKAIDAAGLKSKVRTYGGGYSFRAKRTSSKLSTHCWGIAIDLDPTTNALGSAGDMNPGVVEVFRSFGFKWGGDWTGGGKDPMHFQFCTGY
jgi:hypothetical protein